MSKSLTQHKVLQGKSIDIIYARLLLTINMYLYLSKLLKLAFDD